MLLDALRRFSASVNQPRLFLAKNRVAGPRGGAIVLLMALQRCSASTSFAPSAVILLLHTHRLPADPAGSSLKNGLAEPSGGATHSSPNPTSEISS